MITPPRAPPSKGDGESCGQQARANHEVGKAKRLPRDVGNAPKLRGKGKEELPEQSGSHGKGKVLLARPKAEGQVAKPFGNELGVRKREEIGSPPNEERRGKGREEASSRTGVVQQLGKRNNKGRRGEKEKQEVAPAANGYYEGEMPLLPDQSSRRAKQMLEAQLRKLQILLYGKCERHDEHGRWIPDMNEIMSGRWERKLAREAGTMKEKFAFWRGEKADEEEMD